MSNNWTYDTQNVVVTQAGTGWTIDATPVNLDSDLTLKDFVVLFNNVVQDNSFFTKTTQNALQYTGASLDTPTTVEVRRRTPISPAKIITYGDRFASDDWNREVNRIARRAAEYIVSGVGSIGNIAGVPQNGAYGSAWSTDIVYAPTRQAVYNKVESVINNYTANDSALQTQINVKAPINNAALTGTPTAPTPPANDNSSRIQTTAGAIAYLNGGNATATTQAADKNDDTIATTKHVKDWYKSKVKVRAYRGGVSGISLNALTLLNGWTEEQDTTNSFDPGATSRFTAPRTGGYWFSVYLWGSVNGNPPPSHTLYVQVRINGSTVNPTNIGVGNNSNMNTSVVSVMWRQQLNAGDYIELFSYPAISGGSGNTAWNGNYYLQIDEVL